MKQAKSFSSFAKMNNIPYVAKSMIVFEQLSKNVIKSIPNTVKAKLKIRNNRKVLKDGSYEYTTKDRINFYTDNECEAMMHAVG
jgi:hypothetical protein